ncbi:hypothetical protein PCE1_001272 [Barthelona sp. PCE]
MIKVEVSDIPGFGDAEISFEDGGLFISQQCGRIPQFFDVDTHLEEVLAGLSRASHVPKHKFGGRVWERLWCCPTDHMHYVTVSSMFLTNPSFVLFDVLGSDIQYSGIIDIKGNIFKHDTIFMIDSETIAKQNESETYSLWKRVDGKFVCKSRAMHFDPNKHSGFLGQQFCYEHRYYGACLDNFDNVGTDDSDGIYDYFELEVNMYICKRAECAIMCIPEEKKVDVFYVRKHFPGFEPFVYHISDDFPLFSSELFDMSTVEFWAINTFEKTLVVEACLTCNTLPSFVVFKGGEMRVINLGFNSRGLNLPRTVFTPKFNNLHLLPFAFTFRRNALCTMDTGDLIKKQLFAIPCLSRFSFISQLGIGFKTADNFIFINIPGNTVWYYKRQQMGFRKDDMSFSCNLLKIANTDILAGKTKNRFICFQSTSPRVSERIELHPTGILRREAFLIDSEFIICDVGEKRTIIHLSNEESCEIEHDICLETDILMDESNLCLRFSNVVVRVSGNCVITTPDLSGKQGAFLGFLSEQLHLFSKGIFHVDGNAVARFNQDATLSNTYFCNCTLVLTSIDHATVTQHKYLLSEDSADVRVHVFNMDEWLTTAKYLPLFSMT